MIDADKLARNLQVINGLLFALDVAIEMFDKSNEMRERAAKAVLDRKTIDNEEMAASAKDVKDRIKAARQDN